MIIHILHILHMQFLYTKWNRLLTALTNTARVLKEESR
jgi:hypothetical protein